MTRNLAYIILFFLFFSCSSKEKKGSNTNTAPVVSNNGKNILFTNKESLLFFRTEKVSTNDVQAELSVPGKIAATILPSDEGATQNIVLFDNLELSENYTYLIQHQVNITQIQNINIKKKQLELERTQDLYSHGAATGQDLLNVQIALSMEQTNLANERAALIEHETKLKSWGFNPRVLRNAKAGSAFAICDIPENQIEKIKEGQVCNVNFTAFPSEKFTGRIDAIADMVDNATRMVKVRVSIINATSRIKSGMFANVLFRLSTRLPEGQSGSYISISKSSLVTVQGKSYVFVKKSLNEFERIEIQTGQQIGDRIIVFGGLNNGDEIAIEGVMQLKGLSFGY